MKLTLTYDEVSITSSALQQKAQEAEINARKSKKRIEVEFWRERARIYKKVYTALEAQRMQMLKEIEQAIAALQQE